MRSVCCVFFNDTATTEIYTLSLHDALPISTDWLKVYLKYDQYRDQATEDTKHTIISVAPNIILHKNLVLDRKSTRLNSSHANISYAVFCLKKKNNLNIYTSLSIFKNTSLPT